MDNIVQFKFDDVNLVDMISYLSTIANTPIYISSKGRMFADLEEVKKAYTEVHALVTTRNMIPKFQITRLEFLTLFLIP
ncbi:hypothetical protein M0802_010769 [Mischocyttarus mexicanus]|nr:hypothetical protein M0802_010769 [Mischocyttarus mexicanus]